MASRMDKYNTDINSISNSRLRRNESLYKNIYTNKVYTEFTDVDHSNVVELSDDYREKLTSRREKYHSNKQFNNGLNAYKNEKINYHNISLSSSEDKNYDINDVLANAKKNRIVDDDEEKKRRFKNVEYNILTDLTTEKVKDYKEKKKQLSKAEEDNLEELIHTITSNSLRKKIDDELLSELMPTQDFETVVGDISSLDDENHTINQENNNSDENLEEENDKIDDSFYTRSMELSKDDFVDEEDLSFLENSSMNVWIKLLITILIIAILAVIVYVIYYFI